MDYPPTVNESRGNHTISFRLGDDDRYTATLHRSITPVGSIGFQQAGWSEWRLPAGWVPSSLACARVVDAMMSLAELRDAGSVPVGEVFNMVVGVASELIRKMAQCQADASKFRSQYEEARHQLLQAEATTIEQVAIAVRSVMSANGSPGTVPGAASQQDAMRMLLEAHHAEEGFLAVAAQKVPPRGPVLAAFCRVLGIDPSKLAPYEVRP